MLAIITGTLSPSNKMFAVDLVDIKKRLCQYADMICFLAESRKIDKYVFCENSDSMELLQQLKEVDKSGKKAEYMSFAGSSSSVQYGKGYGEGEILQHVLKESKLLHDEEEFIKITGRIIIRNIDSIVQKMEPGVNYFNTVRPLTRDRQIDTKFYKVSKKDFENYFENAYINVNDLEKRYLEHVYYRIIEKNEVQYRNFPEYPIYEGVSGSIGISYGSVKWKYFLKNLLSKYNLYRDV